MSKMRIENESGDRKYFTIIPNYILNHSTLWDREVYIQMKRITGEDGTCWTSQKTLAKQCGVSINRLKKSLRYLVEHKWITQVGTKEVQTKGGPQEVNEYRVADLWKMNVDFYEAKGVSQNDTPTPKGVSPKQQRGVTVESKGVSPDDDKEEPIQIRTLEEDTPQGGVGNEINSLIELFKEVNPSYELLFRQKPQRAAIARMSKKWGREKLEATIKALAGIIGKPYAPKITTPCQLERDIGRLVAFYKQEGNKNNKFVTI